MTVYVLHGCHGSSSVTIGVFSTYDGAIKAGMVEGSLNDGFEPRDMVIEMLTIDSWKPSRYVDVEYEFVYEDEPNVADRWEFSGFYKATESDPLFRFCKKSKTAHVRVEFGDEQQMKCEAFKILTDWLRR